MPNYQNARLYSIRSYHTDKIYIGSTCSPLSKRLYGHRNCYELFKNGKYPFVSSFEIIQYPDNYVELLRAVPCSSRTELLKLEGEEIRANDNCVNMRIEGRTVQQWHEDNKEHIKNYKKEYYIDNKEQILIKTKQYHEEHREHMNQKKKEYYEEHKEHMDKYYKQWREDNKEDLKKKHKQYYEENKEIMSEKNKEYYQKNKEQSKQRVNRNYHEKKDIRNCLCGGSYNCADNTRINNHYGTQKHKEYVYDFYTRLNKHLTQ